MEGGGINLLLSSPGFRNPNRPAQRDSIKFGKGQEVLTRSPGKIGNLNIHAVHACAVVENDLKFLGSF